MMRCLYEIARRTNPLEKAEMTLHMEGRVSHANIMQIFVCITTGFHVRRSLLAPVIQAKALKAITKIEPQRQLSGGVWASPRNQIQKKPPPP